MWFGKMTCIGVQRGFWLPYDKACVFPFLPFLPLQVQDRWRNLLTVWELRVSSKSLTVWLKEDALDAAHVIDLWFISVTFCCHPFDHCVFYFDNQTNSIKNFLLYLVKNYLTNKFCVGFCRISEDLNFTNFYVFENFLSRHLKTYWFSEF